MNRFYKACLLTIIFLLAIIALHSVAIPQAAIAAEHYRYLVVEASRRTDLLQGELDKRTAEGWELAAPVVLGQETNGVTLIFRKTDQ